MWLIVGLGNPGSEYANTRHNIGFMAVDAIAYAAGIGHQQSKFQSEMRSGDAAGERLILLKPQTYMNLSGRAVQAAMAFFKIPPARIIVMHDELDLPLGKIRIKKGGGAGGHNGLKSIDEAIGSDYWRVRIGIGHPGTPERVHSHVLSGFDLKEVPLVEKVNDAIAQHLPLFWQHSPEAMGSKIAATLNPPPPKAEKPKSASSL